MLPQIKTIIYASDLGESTRPVINMAASIANQYGARVICVHVIEPISDYVHNLIGSNIERSKIDSSFAKNTADAEQLLKDRLDQFIKDEYNSKEVNFDAEVVVVTGQIEEAIINKANEESADLIIMGSRTHSKVGRMMLGSSANKIIHTSKIPVMVIPI